MGARLNGIIFDDLEYPLTRVSRSLYLQVGYLKTVRFGDKVTKEQ